jgi:hypothetical protein
VLAYKFLDTRMRSIYTGTAWRAGEWVESASVDPCRTGVHACEAVDVARWLGSEMWVMELDGEIQRGEHKVAARRGRLVRRLDAYPAAVRELGELAAWRARDRAVPALTAAGQTDASARFAAAASIADLRALRRWAFESLDQDAAWGGLAMLAADAAALLVDGEPPEAPFAGCCSAGVAATLDSPARDAYDEAYDAERRWQSEWLTQRLGLV